MDEVLTYPMVQDKLHMLWIENIGLHSFMWEASSNYSTATILHSLMHG